MVEANRVEVSVVPPGAGESVALPEFAELAARCGLSYGTPDRLDDVMARYGLARPSH